MKKIRFLGLQVDFHLSIRRVKRLQFDLPDWADDTCITTYDVDDKPIPHKIKYYKGSTRFYIDLPKCKDAVKVFLTPLYSIVDGKRVRSTDRKIIVDVYR